MSGSSSYEPPDTERPQLSKRAKQMSKYDVFHRRAARASAQNTAFVHNCADWGEPHYIAMTSLQRHSSFGFNSNSIIEVSSFALAERLAALLNAGHLISLAGDYDRRSRLTFRHQEVARRNRLAGMTAAGKVAARRALTTAVHAPNRKKRAHAIDRASRFTRRAASQRKHASEIARDVVHMAALADPNSPESRARIASRAALRARVAAARLARAAA